VQWSLRRKASAAAIVATQPSPTRWGRLAPGKQAEAALLHGKKPVVANPSYVAYTWSPIGADVPIPEMSLTTQIGATS
jgi:hypothetical protein